MSTMNVLPDFNDENAKVHERIHYVSGATIVEVLYGAKDAEGNSVEPAKDAEDGHGEFVALKTEDVYQLLSWRHSAAEGGAVEYGENCSADVDPLKVLEEDIRAKRSVIDEAREAMKGDAYDTEAADAILARFPEGTNRNTPKERELKTQYNSMVEKNKRNKERFLANKENAEKKRAFIAEAQSLKTTEDWNAATDRMKALMEEWKQTGKAGEENDSLWTEFSAAQQAFYDEKHKHYEALNNERIAKKEELIVKAKEAVEATVDSEWEKTHQCLEKLFAEWKAVGTVGKEADDKLWEKFHEIRNAFYSRRNELRKERDSEFAARRDAKKELIAEAVACAASSDYSQITADRMRKINEEWKKIGSAGRKYEEALWKQLREAQDSYWQGKRENDSSRHEQWVSSTKDAIERRKSRITNIRANMEKLQERLTTTQNPEKKEQIEGWIAENEEQIKTLEEEVARMESELNK